MGVKNNLKEIRMKEHMMNMTQFAEYLGIDIKLLSSWERAKSKPTLEKALEISNKLNKTINDIWYLE